MPTDTPTEYGSVGLTPEQAANEAAAQVSRFSPGTEPAALSSSIGAENFATNIDPTITAANDAITQADQTKEQQQKEKSETTTTTTTPDLTDDPVAAAEAAMMAGWEQQQQEVINTAAALTAAAEKSAKESIKILKGSYNERRKLLEESNRQSQASWRQQFNRFGQSEYSPGMTAEFMGQKEREGMDILTKLDNEYRAQVAAINAAKDQGLYSIAADKTKQLQTLSEKVNQQILANAKEAEEANEKLRENIIKASRENTISNIIAQYDITDPADIQNLVNFDDAGNQTGDITLDEIDKVLKIMGMDSKSQMAGLTADYKTYSHLKKTDPAYKDWSYTEYLAAVSAAKRAPKSGGTTVNSPLSTPEGDLMSFEDFKFSDEAKRLISEEMDRQVAEDGTGSFTTATAEKFLKDIYDQSAAAYYRDNLDGTKKYTASNIPTPLRENLIVDITNDFSLSELISAYPDISSSYITSTYNSLKKKKEEEEESTISDEEFLQSLRGE